MRNNLVFLMALVFSSPSFGQSLFSSVDVISTDTIDIYVELLNGHSGFQFYDDLILHQTPYIIERGDSIGMMNYKKYYYTLDTNVTSEKSEYNRIKKIYGDSIAEMSLNSNQIIYINMSNPYMNNVFLFYNENIKDDGETLLLYYRTFRVVIKYIDMDTIKQSLINLDANHPNESLMVYKSNVRLIVDINFLDDILVRNRIKIIKENDQSSNRKLRFFNWGW